MGIRRIGEMNGRSKDGSAGVLLGSSFVYILCNQNMADPMTAEKSLQVPF